MARYAFLTTWLLDAPRARVWEVLEDVASWPQWWRGVVRVESNGPDRHLVEWRSRVPYSIRFEFEVQHVERPALMEGRARGDLDGRGRWRLIEDGGVTAVIYEWEVTTTKRWMNAVAPVARPVFERNHDLVMRWGGEGLAQRLGVHLLAAG